MHRSNINICTGDDIAVMLGSLTDVILYYLIYIIFKTPHSI